MLQCCGTALVNFDACSGAFFNDQAEGGGPLRGKGGVQGSRDEGWGTRYGVRGVGHIRAGREWKVEGGEQSSSRRQGAEQEQEA